MKYEEFECPLCNKETLHRVKNKYGLNKKGSKKGEPFLKYQVKHCLLCNYYWGYPKQEKRKRSKSISLRKIDLSP